MTKSACLSLEASGAWEEMRAWAADRERLLRDWSRCSWSASELGTEGRTSGDDGQRVISRTASRPAYTQPRRNCCGCAHQKTTMTAPQNFHRPASTSKGASTTTTLSPLNQCFINSHASSLRTAGCTIELSTRRLDSSWKTISPKAGRSSSPVAVMTASPKCLCSCESAYEPGATASRARRSRSTRGNESGGVDSWRETVDLPGWSGQSQPSSGQTTSAGIRYWSRARTGSEGAKHTNEMGCGCYLKLFLLLVRRLRHTGGKHSSA